LALLAPMHAATPKALWLTDQTPTSVNYLFWAKILHGAWNLFCIACSKAPQEFVKAVLIGSGGQDIGMCCKALEAAGIVGGDHMSQHTKV